MPHPLDYASPPAATRIRVSTALDGSTVIEVLPSRTDKVSLSLRLAVAAAAMASILATFCLKDEFPILMGFVVPFVIMGMMGFLVWSAISAPSEHGTGVRLRIVRRGELLELTGSDVPKGAVQLLAHDVQEIRVDFDGGLDGATPHMRLTLCRFSGPAMSLLAEQAPADLLWLADTLRRFAGLSSRSHRMGTWLARKAAGLGLDPGRPLAVVPVGPTAVAAAGHASAVTDLPAIPSTTPVVPVLVYATPQRTRLNKQGVEFNHDEVVIWLPARGPYSAYISATVSRIQVVWHEGVFEFPCARVYGVYVGAASEFAPLKLYLCTLGGVHDLFAGVPPESLRDAARLLNDLLGVEGSVYSI